MFKIFLFQPTVFRLTRQRCNG